MAEPQTAAKALLKLAEQIEAANRADLKDNHEEASDVLSEVLGGLRALAWCYQSAHWQTSGADFYGDHQLFGRLYAETTEQIDSFAEKLIGVTGTSMGVDPVKQAECVLSQVSKICCAGDTYPARLLAAEKDFVGKFLPAALIALEQHGHLTDGLENMIQGVMDAHEGAVYLLQQRCNTSL
jgi:DNA-binding ferritin-like protein